MGRKRRVAVTLSYPMWVALQVTAQKNGLHDSTMAASLLRGALDKVIQSEEVKRQVRLHTAERTAAEWRQETTDERVLEAVYAKVRAEGEMVR